MGRGRISSPNSFAVLANISHGFDLWALILSYKCKMSLKSTDMRLELFSYTPNPKTNISSNKVHLSLTVVIMILAVWVLLTRTAFGKYLLVFIWLITHYPSRSRLYIYSASYSTSYDTYDFSTLTTRLWELKLLNSPVVPRHQLSR